jgi:hypothetical protein
MAVAEVPAGPMLRRLRFCALASLLWCAIPSAQAPTAAPPFGSLDTPADGSSALTGAIAITGWALDDIGVRKVDILRDAHPNDPPGAVVNGRVFVGTASFVSGARPDLAALFPNYPNAARGGFGYLMLTRGLVWDGQGAFNLYAVATDTEGNETTLGSKMITVANAAADKPFGSIDTPAQGGVVSGTFVNFGWVLPLAGRTIAPGSVRVAIDNVILPQSSECLTSRPDISQAFPAFNTSQAIRCFTIDSTKYANGLHTIGWVVIDSTGAADGIGSRFFTIANPPLTFDSGVTADDQEKVRRAIAMATAYTHAQGLSTAGDFEAVSLTNQDRLIQATPAVVGWSLDQSKAYWTSGGCGFAGSRLPGRYLLFNAACAGWRSSIFQLYTHEYFHLVQYRLVEPFALVSGSNDQTPRGGPQWLLEGSADLVSLKILDANGLDSYDTGRLERLKAAAKSSTPLETTESWTGMAAADGGTAASYALGFAATERLVNTAGLQSLEAFWTGIGTGLTWQESFRRAFGRTIEVFYQEFAQYRATLTP